MMRYTRYGLLLSGLGVYPRGKRPQHSDTPNHRNQGFNEGGGFLAGWVSKGSQHGQLLFPSGIALDDEGHVVVTNYGNNRVQAFNTEGKFPGTRQEPGGLSVRNKGTSSPSMRWLGTRPARSMSVPVQVVKRRLVDCRSSTLTLLGTPKSVQPRLLILARKAHLPSQTERGNHRTGYSTGTQRAETVNKGR